MSRIPIVMNQNEYICSALEEIRTMDDTKTYAALRSAVERIQVHANKMETAIHKSADFRYDIYSACRDKELSDEEFRKKIMKYYKEHTKHFPDKEAEREVTTIMVNGEPVVIHNVPGMEYFE